MATSVRGWPAPRNALGQSGEELAAVYLERSAGMRVLARNWRCAAGEIDIVARTAEVLVVVEVKTRTSLRFGSPLEAVTPQKRRRLRRLARLWAVENGACGARTRVDAVAVLAPPHAPCRIKHQPGVA